MRILVQQKRDKNSDNPGKTQDSQLPCAPAAESMTQRTNALCRGLHLVLEHHAAGTEVLQELARQVHGYLDTSSGETVWLKRCKHLLTYPLSKYLRNDPPAPPDAVFAPAGSLRAWMKVRLFVFSRKNTHLWYSWFQAKRSTLPLSEITIDKTYDDHFATLSKEDDGDDSTIQAIFADPTFMKVLSEIRKSFTSKYNSVPAFDQMSASTSACFEATRGKGGQNGELLRLSAVNESVEGELSRMIWSPAGYSRGERVINALFEVRRPYGADQWCSELNRKLKLRDLSKPVDCTIQAVLEPNKVRVISKGEALPYYGCRPIQKALHGVMRDMPPFRLIGRPFCPTDMIDLAAKARPDWEWFSVDYSAATDGLSWKYSGKIFRYLMQDLPREEYDLAMAVLGPHRLHYPAGRGPPIFRGLQRNGQLMGSILSFPILCLANLGVYLLSTQSLHRNWTHGERLGHVLINGDDMVYAAHPSFWQTHVEVGRKVGLTMSVGKAYRHPSYANINSTSVHYDLRQFPLGLARRDLRYEPTPWQIGYLNAGLFFGQHKVQEREGPAESGSEDVDSCAEALELASAHLGQDPSNGLVSNLPCVLSGALPGKQSELLKRFLNYHGSRIDDETFCAVKRNGRWQHHHRNLFLPLSVGGMGVLAPPGFDFKVSHSDRHLASHALTLPYLRTTQFPLPGLNLEDAVEFDGAAFLKPRGLKLLVPELIAHGVKLAAKKTLIGFKYYQPSIGLEGQALRVQTNEFFDDVLRERRAAYSRQTLEELIDQCYDENPVGTYDRPPRFERATHVDDVRTGFEVGSFEICSLPVVVDLEADLSAFRSEWLREIRSSC